MHDPVSHIMPRVWCILVHLSQVQKVAPEAHWCAKCKDVLLVHGRAPSARWCTRRATLLARFANLFLKMDFKDFLLSFDFEKSDFNYEIY